MKLRIHDWQMYWSNWWKIWPWWNVSPADEYGPSELFFGIGPFQFRMYLWEYRA